MKLEIRIANIGRDFLPKEPSKGPIMITPSSDDFRDMLYDARDGKADACKRFGWRLFKKALRSNEEVVLIGILNYLSNQYHNNEELQNKTDEEGWIDVIELVKIGFDSIHIDDESVLDMALSVFSFIRLSKQSKLVRVVT
jgi:hypothetical protein